MWPFSACSTEQEEAFAPADTPVVEMRSSGALTRIPFTASAAAADGSTAEVQLTQLRQTLAMERQKHSTEMHLVRCMLTVS